MTESAIPSFNRRCAHSLAIIFLIIMTVHLSFHFYSNTVQLVPTSITSYRRRIECTCSRPALPADNSSNGQQPLCSIYATRRGPHQRIISISLFGPKENKMFQVNSSLTFLYDLIKDMNLIYPDNFILRVHHDDTLNATDVICPIECRNANVDFCSMKEKLYIPPKIWRFIPAGDPLVHIMMSRDLDSALTGRERAAVNAWLASNKSFHTMRDHPMHDVPMLGGMWGFRPSMNRAFSREIHNKIHDPALVKKYGGRGDQTFLTNEVWSRAKASAIAHDSFLCQHDFGLKSEPFPTQRPSANQTDCFIGCARSCCVHGKMPFGECPKACRPLNHPEWIYC